MTFRRKRKRDGGGDDDDVPLDAKERTSTVVTGLVSHAVDPAVVRMVEIACNEWDVVTCFGNDAVHWYCLHALGNGLPLPDLESKSFWQFAFKYTAMRSIAGGGLRDTALQAAFIAQYDDVFNGHDTIRRGNHDNFFEYMATAEATAYHNYASDQKGMETLNDHLVIYLKGKYQLRWKSWARALAVRIVAPEPLNFTSMHNQLVADRGMVWIRQVIRLEAAERNRLLAMDNGPLRFRHWMLEQLDTMVALHDEWFDGEDVPLPKRFTLLPFHSCGSTRLAALCGNTMRRLLPRIRESHPEFYAQANADPRLSGKLDTYFNAPRKNGWLPGRQVRSNGVELHTLYDKNKIYMANGRPIKRARKWIASDKDFDIPTECIQCEPTDIAAVDPGYHNLMSAVRWTGAVDTNGERIFEKRFVTKKWYDRRSGRKKVRQRTAARTNRAQKQGLLDAITRNTLKTVDPAAFLRAINARRESYAALYQHNNNMRFKKLKFAMRQRTERAIEQLVDYITWEGTAVTVIGDCSKTTGFRGQTPGGPLAKIKRRMVKKGLKVVEEKEGYSSKSSVCCPGHRNEEMKNGHAIEEYRNGFFLDEPAKMPRKVHGLLICTRCKRTWNRDVVGAINILDIYLARMQGLPRPARFTRAFWN